MELSESDAKIIFTEESRSTLFFDKWRWCVSWRQPEIAVLRGTDLNPAKISSVLASRKHWEKARTSTLGRLRPEFKSRITQEVEEHIEYVRLWLLTNDCPKKIVYSTGQINIYTSDKDTVDQAIEIAKSITLGSIKVKQANVDLPPDTVILKREYGYKFRTYFKSRDLSDNAKATLHAWTTNMGSHVYVCPSMKKFLNGNSTVGWRRPNWTWDHYFVDHNDPRLDFWIAMVCPGIIRKTMAIQSPAK